jgi:flagellar biosynthesis protein
VDEHRARRLRRAVALRYDRASGGAPTVAATGSGYVADRIIEIAREHGVPIREDPDLVQLLSRLDLDQAIPPELYGVIAEVFAFVYRLNAERGRPV